MCGRYTLRRLDLLKAALAALFPQFEEFSEKVTPRFNIAINQAAPIIYLDRNGEGRMDMAQWSLVPSTAKERLKLATFNAHSDRLQSSPLWRGPFNTHRCIVPVDGWYEWPIIDNRKRPMYIHRADDDLFGFAGLYSWWRPLGVDEPIPTFSIVTATPDEFGKTYHDRWPVILDRSDYHRWLDRNIDGAEVQDLVKPSSDGLEAYEVAKAIGPSKRENDRPALINRL